MSHTTSGYVKLLLRHVHGEQELQVILKIL